MEHVVLWITTKLKCFLLVLANFSIVSDMLFLDFLLNTFLFLSLYLSIFCSYYGHHCWNLHNMCHCLHHVLCHNVPLLPQEKTFNSTWPSPEATPSWSGLYSHETNRKSWSFFARDTWSKIFSTSTYEELPSTTNPFPSTTWPQISNETIRSTTWNNR